MVPEPYRLNRRINEIDPDILNVKHVEELGYSTHAVMQISTALVADDLERLVGEVRELVGELDFGFRVGDSVGEESSEGIKGKRD